MNKRRHKLNTKRLWKKIVAPLLVDEIRHKINDRRKKSYAK